MRANRGDGSIETKDSRHKAEGLLGSRTVSGLSSSRLGKDTLYTGTFCNKKGHLVETCWRKQKLIRSNKIWKDKEPVVKNEANLNEDSTVVTTAFILIGVKDDKGNLLQVVADSGASICAIKESKVLQAEHIILPS